MEDSKYYKVKSWVDAKDTSGIWRMARIKTKKLVNKKPVFTVHFDGWSGKHNLSYCLHSPSLAPLRKYSKGYTGQVSVSLREWDFNEDILKVHDVQMKKLSSTRFQSLSAYDLSLFMRGDLFVHIDCLLTFTYTNPARDIKIVEGFLLQSIKFCANWMDCVAVCKFPASDYMNNVNDSIVMSAFEVFEIMRSVLGFNKRTKKFYTTYKFFTSNKEMCAIFVQGLEKFIEMTEKFEPETYWKLFFVVPFILDHLDTNADNEVVSRYIAKLILIIDNHSELIIQKETQDYLETWLHVLNKLTDKETISVIKKKLNIREYNVEDLKIEVLDSAEGSMVEHEEFVNRLEETMSPIKPNISLLRATNLEIDKWSSNEKPALTSSEDEAPKPVLLAKPLTKYEFSALTEKINEKFTEVQDKISKAVFPAADSSQNSLPLSDALQGGADTAESQILDRLEYLLQQRNSLEALKIVRWRKKICKIAILDGWELADHISRASVSSLKVTTNDVIQANLSSFIKKFDDN